MDKDRIPVLSWYFDKKVFVLRLINHLGLGRCFWQLEGMRKYVTLASVVHI